MVGTIGPLVSNRIGVSRYGLLTSHIAGLLLGSLVFGVAVALVGSVLGRLIPANTLVGTTGAVVAALLFVFGVRGPGPRRQVPPGRVDPSTPVAGAFSYGVELGVVYRSNVLTPVPTVLLGLAIAGWDAWFVVLAATMFCVGRSAGFAFGVLGLHRHRSESMWSGAVASKRLLVAATTMFALTTLIAVLLRADSVGTSL